MNQRKRVAAGAAEATAEAVREWVAESAAAVATTYLFLSVMPSVFGLPGTTGFIMRL
jgi:hypothetical protein